MDIGFVGVGKMGGPMARRLIAAGHCVLVCDVDAQACAGLSLLGAEIRATPAQVARDCRNVITSLPSAREVETVMRRADGLVASVCPGTLVMETSTIGPALSRELAREFAGRNARYLDCPVSNGVAAAQNGTLTFMIGGDGADVARAKPMLAHLAAQVFHLGPVGSGNVAKLLNQNIYLSYVAAFCESLRLGRRAGLDVRTLLDVLRNSVAGDPLMTAWEKRIETGDLAPGWAIRRVLKDMALGADVCAEHAFDAPILAAAMRAFREIGEAGHMEHDLTALFTAGPR